MTRHGNRDDHTNSHTFFPDRLWLLQLQHTPAAVVGKTTKSRSAGVALIPYAENRVAAACCTELSCSLALRIHPSAGCCTLPVVNKVGACLVAHQQLAVMTIVHVSPLHHGETAAILCI